MATNPFFNNFQSYPEQGLLEDLIIESIKMYGHDLYYCPRSLKGVDDIFREDRVSEYNNHFFVEMYLKNVEGFSGEGDFLSKFNIQLRDEYTFVIANRTFSQEIGMHTGQIRPQEGDLIYFPLSDKVYIIKYAEHEAPAFYQLGGLYCYELKCEAFEYSNERLNTGVPKIDDLENKFTLNTGDVDANNNVIMNPTTGHANNADDFSPDYRSEDDTFELNANSFIDFSERNPFAHGDY